MKVQRGEVAFARFGKVLKGIYYIRFTTCYIEATVQCNRNSLVWKRQCGRTLCPKEVVSRTPEILVKRLSPEVQVEELVYDLTEGATSVYDAKKRKTGYAETANQRTTSRGILCRRAWWREAALACRSFVDGLSMLKDMIITWYGTDQDIQSSSCDTSEGLNTLRVARIILRFELAMLLDSRGI